LLDRHLDLLDEVRRRLGRLLPVGFVLIQSSWENSTYCGTISTWTGSISVASMAAKNRLRPRKFSRAKA
jgi:hypothetical protein